MEEGELDPAPVFSDVKTFPFEELRGTVGILSAGFPCQPWSNAGRRAGIEDPRHIYPWIADGISACRPSLVFLENVEGIISCKLAGEEKTSALRLVLEDLESRGYETTWGIFSAAEVGAPHQRKRVFILARLAESESGEPRKPEAGNGGQGVGGGSEEERGYSTIEGVIRQNTENPVEEEELADSSGNDVERRDLRQGEVQLGRGCSRDEEHWPARPNESQHDWEEPRVVSKLGRATHGSACGLDPTTHRVDRLRLLGNGVVPATAEKAFRTLFAELNHDN